MLKKSIIYTFSSLVFLYLSFNILLVVFIPVSHNFTLTITVLDSLTKQPIQGETIDGKHAFGRLGKTSTNGKLIDTRIFQENPEWIWPKFGRYKNWTGLSIVITAPGYIPKEIMLTDMYTSAGDENQVGQHNVMLIRE